MCCRLLISQLWILLVLDHSRGGGKAQSISIELAPPAYLIHHFQKINHGCNRSPEMSQVQNKHISTGADPQSWKYQKTSPDTVASSWIQGTMPSKTVVISELPFSLFCLTTSEGAILFLYVDSTSEGAKSTNAYIFCCKLNKILLPACSAVVVQGQLWNRVAKSHACLLTDCKKTGAPCCFSSAAFNWYQPGHMETPR